MCLKPLHVSSHASAHNLIRTILTYQLEGWVFKLMKGIPDEQQAKL